MRSEGKGHVLVVDDERNAVKVLSAILGSEGYRVTESSNVDKAIGALAENEMDAVITDVKMPGKDGSALFDYLKMNHPAMPVMFLTAYGTIDSAVNAMASGVFYYFIKPPDYAKLLEIVGKAVEQKHQRTQRAPKEADKEDEDEEFRMIGRSGKLLDLMKTIEDAKDSPSSLLITGETGTGKELVARNIHFRGVRRNKPFVALNCAAIPKELIEAEIFGCEKGAYTGAFAQRKGKFEEAQGGTILLDEIGELDMALQAKLLRVLQEKEIERLGSNKKIKVDFRLLCSTNRDLREAVEKGEFRKDLFYRVNVVNLNVPPLRERLEDIPLLTSVFLKQFCRREEKPLMISKNAREILENYPWPGNIRELKNVIERAVIIAREDTITQNELPEEMRTQGDKPKVNHHSHQWMPLKSRELEAVKEAILACDGNKSKAARLLGISRKALYKRLNDLGMN